MEFDNPIKLLNWFLGNWEGTLIENNVEYGSKIVWKNYGYETHVLEIYKKVEDSEMLIETQYLFFDKTKEQIKCIIFNTEGYVESSNVEMNFKESHMSLKATFDFGYNLPPNIKIVREISKGEKDSLVYIVKMGEKQQIFFKANYRRKQ